MGGEFGPLNAPEEPAAMVEALFSRRISKPGNNFDSWGNAEQICKGMARLPASMFDDDELPHLTRLMQRLVRMEKGSGLSLLALVVEAMPVAVEPNRRRTGILPETMRATRFTAYGAGAEGQNSLRLSGGSVGDIGAGPVQGTLFGFVAPATSLVPVLPLRLYSDAGGLDRARGHGAPLPKRIWWAAIANTPIAARERDGSIRLTTTLRDLNDWLYPGGRWRSRNLDRLRRALLEVDGTRIIWERREWRIVGVDALPDASTRLDDPLPLRVAMPPGSDRGALIDLPKMYKAGTVSGPVFDAWIRLAYLWDAAKGRNGGKRVYVTRLKVRRDDRDRLIDAAGNIIAGPDPARPWRERRGVPADKPVMSWRDSRAVVVGEERNPVADRVPELDRRDLVRLFHGDTFNGEGEALRKAAHEARRMLMAHIKSPGYVMVEERTKGKELEAVRILEPRPLMLR